MSDYHEQAASGEHPWSFEEYYEAKEWVRDMEATLIDEGFSGQEFEQEQAGGLGSNMDAGTKVYAMFTMYLAEKYGRKLAFPHYTRYVAIEQFFVDYHEKLLFLGHLKLNESGEVEVRPELIQSLCALRFGPSQGQAGEEQPMFDYEEVISDTENRIAFGEECS